MPVTKGENVIALLDGDIVAVRSAAIFDAKDGHEEDLLYAIVRKIIREWTLAASADDFRICMSLGKSFRYEAYPQYKSNRKAPKPRGTDEAKEYLRENYTCLEYATLEADDIMGILATEPETPETRIIVSTDKDMLQLPAWQVNPDKDRFPHRPSDDDTHRMLMYQWTCGDPGDGYPGIPKFGESRFNKWYSRHSPVFHLYEQWGQTLEHCVAMRKCAKLLQWEERPPNWAVTL